jgi:hypothetical protein
MKKDFNKKNVDPRVAAVAIVVVLGVIQYIWWQGLVAKPKKTTGFGSQTTGMQ